MKKRYMFYFSYVGTFFKSSTKTQKNADVTSVVGTLEIALQALSKKFFVQDASRITLSSRTDRGVHALQNAAHVDCTLRQDKNIEKLIIGVNYFCEKRSIPLRILSIRQVSDDFNARKFATQRTYLYRVGVPKFDNLHEGAYVPISEVNYCYFLRESNFNVDALKEAVSIFHGVHDFTFFCGKPSQQIIQRSPIRRIDSFSVCPGKPLMSSLYEPLTDNFNYWDFIVEGRSFVYNQVRRMVSAALCVAQGKCTVVDLQRSLDSATAATGKLQLIPAHGLFLVKVTYNERNLAIHRVRLVNKEHIKLCQMLDQYKLSLEKSTQTTSK